MVLHIEEGQESLIHNLHGEVKYKKTTIIIPILVILSESQFQFDSKL